MYDNERYNDYLNDTLNVILKNLCNPDEIQRKIIDENINIVFNGNTYRFLTKEEYEGELSDHLRW